MKFKKSKDEKKKAALSVADVSNKIGKFIFKALQILFLLIVLFSFIAIPLLVVFS